MDDFGDVATAKLQRTQALMRIKEIFDVNVTSARVTLHLAFCEPCVTPCERIQLHVTGVREFRTVAQSLAWGYYHRVMLDSVFHIVRYKPFGTLLIHVEQSTQCVIIRVYIGLWTYLHHIDIRIAC